MSKVPDTFQDKKLELWGGIECTVNRTHDVYHDQIRRSGHDRRLADLDLFAQIGFSAIRYPLLWERIAANGPAAIDWSWADERMNRLRRSGAPRSTAIATLL